MCMENVHAHIENPANADKKVVKRWRFIEYDGNNRRQHAYGVEKVGQWNKADLGQGEYEPDSHGYHVYQSLADVPVKTSLRPYGKLRQVRVRGWLATGIGDGHGNNGDTGVETYAEMYVPKRNEKLRDEIRSAAKIRAANKQRS